MAAAGRRAATCSGLVMVLILLSQQVTLQATAWSFGHATFYGGADASGTNNGACGYNNVFALGYGTLTAALSAPLFQNGAACGACYQIMCSGGAGCTGSSITVTATNLCPEGSTGGWCDSPNYHMDLSQPAFSQIAQVSTGHVALQFQKVACSRSGGMKFVVQGHTYFMQVLIYNVGGMGDISGVQVKGARVGWTPMVRGWGVTFQTTTILDGQPLSFMVTTSDGRALPSMNVAAAYWQYGQTFQGSQF